MKKQLLHLMMLVMAVAVGPLAFAQHDDDGPPIPEERMQEIKAQKSAYLTKKMNLSPEEAQRFWPIYNQMDEELGKARREHMQFKRALRQNEETLTEKEASEFLDREIAMREKDLQVRKKYDPQLRKAIGAQKLVQLHKAERDFHREVVRRYRERGDGEGRRPGH